MAAVDFSRFASVLKDLGVAGEVRVLPEPAPSAAAAAAQLGCDVGAIANSLVFAADGAPLLVMTSGAHRVDPARVAALAGAGVVARADPRSVRAWTGQVIGGVGPVGHPAPIRTLVDDWLARYDVVWAAAGHPHAVFPTCFDELVRITGGISAEVGALFRATRRGGGGAGRAASACAAATFRGDTSRPSVMTSQVDCDVARGLWHGYRLHCH